MKSTVKNAIKELKKFAKNHDLVEFGALLHADDIRPAGGFTYQRFRKDLYFSYGNTETRDISLTLRDFRLASSVAGQQNNYVWVVLETHLPAGHYPTVFIDSHQGDNQLYVHLVDVLGSLKHAKVLFGDTAFTSSFHVFASSQTSHLLPRFIDAEMQAKMLNNYAGLSFEVEGNELLIYSDASTVTFAKLKNMLDACLYISEHFEAHSGAV